MSVSTRNAAVRRIVQAVIGVVVLAVSASSTGETVAVRHAEGLVHGFLSLRDLDGSVIADGDLIQTSQGARVTSRLVFHFKDGSVHDETAVFSQRGQFRLISDRLIQKGRSFPQPIDMQIDVRSGRVVVRYDDHGEEKTDSENLSLPPDLANGLVMTLLKNAVAAHPPAAFAFVAATPKPRLVKLAVRVVGDEPFSTGSVGRKATHYALKVDIGGLAGLVAPLVGKEPPDSHVWVLEGEAPAFVKSEQQLYYGGPVWRIELVSPTWPRSTATQTKR
jgi:hypothetical protein